MPVEQREIFCESEADRWFERNKNGLGQCDARRDLPLRLIDK